jgi:hypothetical protein
VVILFESPVELAYGMLLSSPPGFLVNSALDEQNACIEVMKMDMIRLQEGMKMMVDAVIWFSRCFSCSAHFDNYNFISWFTNTL